MDFILDDNKRMSSYSVEDIDKARKLQKKNGKSFMDNLYEITGKSLPDTTNIAQDQSALLAQLKDMQKRTEALAKRGDSINLALVNNQSKINKDIEELTKNIVTDFGTMPAMKDQNAQAALNNEVSMEVSQEKEAVDIASFNWLSDVLSETIYGQEGFIKKLIIAFKRPFVLPVENNFPMNSFYVCGPEDTGKHRAIHALATEMKKRRIISSDEVKVMDLSLYPNVGAEKLFLQDLYVSIKANGQIVLFENFDKCHPSYLTYISSLIMTGKCQLPERYVMQKGQLVSVANSFASNAISYFTAKDKYLILISTKPVSKLADALGAPFINSLGDICESKTLEKEDYEKISGVELTKLIEKSKVNLSFEVETNKEEWISYSLTSTEKGAGLTGLLNFYEKVLKALAQLRLEGDYNKNEKLTLSFEDGNIIATINEEKINLLAGLPTGYKGEIDAVKAEMDKIIGLTEIKKYVLGLEEYYDVMRRRKEQGLKAGELNKHMIFTGNPGTGKTTIARIISRYLKAMGVLSGGQLVEVTRADLVGRYVGHTAPLTNQVINSALGGVLFIDEAYSLYRSKDDAFGIEAIDTLVKGIEDHRDDLIVILAGYSKEMEEFLSANSGLKSRFPNIINFPDYTGDELFEITKITAKSKGYVIEDDAELPLKTYYNAVQATRASDAGNGRLVRNKVEEAILNQSRRLVVEKDADLSLLTTLDFDLSDI